MAEAILIELDLDESKIDAAVQRTGDKTKKEFERVGSEVETTVNKSVSLLTGLTKVVSGLSAALVVSPPIGQGLFGTISKLSFASAGLFALAAALETTNNKFADTAASAARFASILTGGLSAALGFAVLKVSDLAFQFGTRLVTSLQASRDKANEFISSQNILNKVIENYNVVTGGAVGSTEDWQKTIDKLSTSLNISTKELNKSAQEVISVGSQIGLTSEQMQKLTKVSAEYAKVNKKDVFNTSLAVVKALNGNAQAVQALGIKLNETAVQQFAFSEGITKSFNQLTENEKVQLRFNKLLKQYKNITGIAAVAAGQLSDQENALNVTVEKLNANFGAGVAIVENYNLASKALNVIAGTLNEGFVEATGFLSALGARFLQVTGFLVNFGFKIFVVLKAFKLLQTVLDANISTTTLLTKKIGFLNVSIVDLVKNLSRGRVGLNELVGAGNKARGVVSSLLKPLLAFKSSGSLSVFASLRQIFGLLAQSVGRFAVLLTPALFVLAKFAAIAAVVLAPVIALGKAFKAVEERTGAFSTIYAVVIDTLSATASVLDPVIELYNRFTSAISTLVNKGFGLLISGAARLTQLFVELAASNPFGIFGDDAVAKISAVNGRLQALQNQLVAVNFDASKLSEEGSRSIANLAESSSVNIENLVKKLNSLRDAFVDFGVSDEQKIENERQRRLETIGLSLENELIQQEEFNLLKQQINQDAANKLQAIEDAANKKRIKQQDRANSIIKQGLTQGISGGIQNVVKALAAGENVFESFGKFLLTTFGDIAIQLGQFYIAQGLATLALLKSPLAPTAAIAAGAGLVALGALLKSIAGSGGGEGGSSNASFGSSAGDFSNSQFEDEFETAEPESIERQPNNQIIVQGSIVDPQGIIDAVNQVSEENGAVLTGVNFA